MARDVSRTVSGPLLAFCARLKRLQVASGMTQVALAHHVSLGKSQMSDILNGNIRDLPDKDLIDMVVHACLDHARKTTKPLSANLGDEDEWRRRYNDLEYDFEVVAPHPRRRTLDPPSVRAPVLDRQDVVLLAQSRLHDAKGQLRKVSDCTDPVALGVHPAARADADAAETLASKQDAEPAYVARDADANPLLTEAFERGGLVIIEGASAAGKTRMAFEAMQRLAANRWLVVPDNLSSLRALKDAKVRLRNTVVWLDDIDDYLTTGGLDASVLDALCPPGSVEVLLGTLRSEARRNLRAASQDISINRAIQDIINRASLIRLDRALSPAERARAELNREDSRIAAALDQQTGAGFAEYIAAAPAAFLRWQSARDGEDLVAGAVISAAVDARRAGFRSPIPVTLLEALHICYLAARDKHRAGNSSFAEALIWATEPVKGASSCLIPLSTDSYEPFDYLVDRAQATSSIRDIPAEAWPALLSSAQGGDLISLGYSAHQAERRDIAERAWLRAAEGGELTAMFNLGEMFRETDLVQAEKWSRRAAEAGFIGAMNSMGLLLNRLGRMREAERWYRLAGSAGDAHAMYNLGNMLMATGRTDEAQQWFQRSAETGHAAAMFNFGCTFRETEPATAERWWRRAAAAGHDFAMINLGVVLADPGEAEHWARLAAETGKPDAFYNLGYLLEETKRSEEAEIWYRRAAESNHAAAMFRLGVMLNETRPAEAGQWWQRCAETEDLDAMFNLGVLANAADRLDEAEHWYMRAASAGHIASMNNLGTLLCETKPEEAEYWYWLAADAGDTTAINNLDLIRHTMDRERCEHWCRRAAETGHVKAMDWLALLISETHQTEAEQWWRRAAGDGHVDAMYNLGVALKETGRLAEASQWWRKAADAGDIQASYNLGVLLHETDPAEAEKFYRRAAESDHKRAMHNLSALLRESNPTEAELWSSRAAEANQSATGT